MILADSFRVAWIDLCFIRRNLSSVLITSLVGPLLYLVAFGYGLGKGMTVDGFDYMSFMIPGIIALTTLTACFSTTAVKVMVQRTYFQSFDELFLCSMNPAAIVLGKAYGGMVRSLISCAILYVVGLLITPDLRFTLSAVLMILLASLTYSLIGVVAGMLSNSHLTMNMITALIITPMTFLCGTLFSVDALPGFAQAILYALPLTHTTDCIRSAMLGTGFDWIGFAVTMVYFIGTFVICYYLMVKGKR